MDLRLCVLCGLLFAFAFESSCQVTNNIKCGEKTVLTCEAPSAPSLYMVWIADNTNLAVCTTAGCTATPEMPPNYAATQSATRTTFNLTINPVLLVDNRTFLCQVDAVNIKSMMVVPTVALLASNSTIATNEVADNATIIFTSNCIDRADQIHLTLEMKKVNSNDTFKTYPDGDINVIKGSINCTNSDNPDCGGNKTQKAHHKMTIKTANDGELYDFKLIAEYNGYETSFDNIGPFKLRSDTHAVPTTVSSSSQSPKHTTSTTRLMSTLASSTITDITTDKLSTTGSPDKQSATSLNEPFIYLIVGCVVLLVVTLACVINVGFIIHRKRQKHIETFDKSEVVSKTLCENETVSKTDSQTYHAIEQQRDSQTDQTSEQL